MKNIWPIGIAAFFAVFIIGMVTFIIWATHQRADLVSPSYYDDELRYQQHIDAIKAAQGSGVAPKILFDAAARRIELRFPQPASLAAATGTVVLFRPSEAALDQNLPLQPDASGVQQIAAADLKPGLWRVKAEWTAAGRAYYAEDTVMIQ